MHPFQSSIQAPTGQQLEALGQQNDLYMAVSPTTCHHLWHITIAENLSYPFKPEGRWMQESTVCCCKDRPQPLTWSCGEHAALRRVQAPKEGQDGTGIEESPPATYAVPSNFPKKAAPREPMPGEETTLNHHSCPPVELRIPCGCS